MFQTSQDILYLSISFTVLFIGLAIGWGCIYVTLILRDLKQMTKSTRKKLDLIDQILDIVKKKVETTANYLPPLLEGLGKLATHFKEKKEIKKAKRKK